MQPVHAHRPLLIMHVLIVHAGSVMHDHMHKIILQSVLSDNPHILADIESKNFQL